ncbi:MAG: hypothetical protein EA398_13520 [Deltaproteobacteria bacterium]|nr:MAG: hypothetical protein EA398_13520 [Deltaproteobacteria bacterium]
MALQASGPISIGDINEEKGDSRTTQASLQGLATTDVNQDSPVVPSSTAPFALSDWYGYDHTFTPVVTPSITSATASALGIGCVVELVFTVGDNTRSARVRHNINGGTWSSPGTYNLGPNETLSSPVQVTASDEADTVQFEIIPYELINLGGIAGSATFRSESPTNCGGF